MIVEEVQQLTVLCSFAHLNTQFYNKFPAASIGENQNFTYAGNQGLK